MNWQPLIDAGAQILTFWLWPWMLALTWLVFLFGRRTWIRWFDSLGWNGVREGFASFGNSHYSLAMAQREAQEPRPTTVTSLARSS